VSHNLEGVASFCDRALWLGGGTARMIGPSRDVVDAYGEWASGHSTNA
jgi:teichoic acid transport system ATP-binding protein